jgi:hypothetical protein
VERRELIALLMESPFYFATPLPERLKLLRYYENKFAKNSSNEGCANGMSQPDPSKDALPVNSLFANIFRGT